MLFRLLLVRTASSSSQNLRLLDLFGPVSRNQIVGILDMPDREAGLHTPE